MPLPGNVLAMPFEVNKAYDDPAPWRHAAAFRLSRDGGRTWNEYHEVMSDPDQRIMFWDQHHARNTAGDHVAAFWVYDHVAAADATIHLRLAEVRPEQSDRSTLNGGNGDDVLFAAGKDCLIFGGAGNDKLAAGGGTLFGEGGDDSIFAASEPGSMWTAAKGGIPPPSIVISTL